MRILLIGAGGQLGSDLVKTLSWADLIPLTHAEVEVSDLESLRAAFAQHRPELVINTAAWHRVDDIERQPERAFAVNTYGARHLALACREFDCALMHLSTDYVFDGKKRTPYEETDAPNPISAYGISKLAGEQFIRYLWPRHYIVRSSGLYGVAGSSGKGGNFVETMLRLARAGQAIKVVDDQVTTPTYTADLARALADLAKTGRYGLYHVSNQGHCSWYEFAAKIFQLSGIEADLSPITSEAFGAPARRPAYSVMAHKALRAAGVEALRHWTEALADYLRARTLREG